MVMKKLLIATICAVAISLSAVLVSNSFNNQPILFQNVDLLAESEGSDCYSGGPGSSNCTIEAGVKFLGIEIKVGCSVTCGEGYYACCGLRCVCVENS